MVVEWPAGGDVLARHEGLEDLVHRLVCGIGAGHAVINDNGSLQLGNVPPGSLQCGSSRGEVRTAIHAGEGGRPGVEIGTCSIRLILAYFR